MKKPNKMETADKGILRPKLSPSEERWAGKLGDEYTNRNTSLALLIPRKKFWEEIKEKYKPKSVLEVGCNRGHNIACFSRYDKRSCLWGIDINNKSLRIAHELYRNVEFEETSVTDMPFKDNYFDLVFTAGLLIHIPPEDIKKAMIEIIRVSKRYILAIEYYAPIEKERSFLGEMGITWERPYNVLYLDRGLQPLETGFLTKDDGFNNLNWGMFRK